MTYRPDLRPWAVFRRVSAVDNICVARFRTRPDADAYMSILRRLTPGANFQVVFDKLPQQVTQG
ncbi:hypothetical protein [Halotia branconii]|uniref:Uncharacterized protein n=1 Tax=Halotia branconii CENA392 TaxID=1539056 RepID=A0AAJ6NMQ3_9CYAN|nr:hypothetical protein [Halotia branconii]WGV23359.1 hypothetical protein QI031_16155 [Halotia branconii CENA392]